MGGIHPFIRLKRSAMSRLAAAGVVAAVSMVRAAGGIAAIETINCCRNSRSRSSERSLPNAARSGLPIRRSCSSNGNVQAHEDDLAPGSLDRSSGSIRKIRRDGRLRSESEDQGVPGLGSFIEHREPELLAQFDKPLAAEREDRRYGIDHQMIVE
jgi:hypothetical protein